MRERSDLELIRLREDALNRAPPFLLTLRCVLELVMALEKWPWLSLNRLYDDDESQGLNQS